MKLIMIMTQRFPFDMSSILALVIKRQLIRLMVLSTSCSLTFVTHKSSHPMLEQTPMPETNVKAGFNNPSGLLLKDYKGLSQGANPWGCALKFRTVLLLKDANKCKCIKIDTDVLKMKECQIPP
jgi:hypothetical protein